jgi:ElaB/YqjD/DUF883 family membrane-anchored ribosome-binding protein
MNSIGSKKLDGSKDKLMHDVHAVLGDVEELLQATANQGGDKVAAIRAKISGSLADAKDSYLATQQQLVDKAKAAAKATDQYVQENPWQSVFIASGVGFIVGLITYRLVSSSKS